MPALVMHGGGDQFIQNAGAALLSTTHPQKSDVLVSAAGAASAWIPNHSSRTGDI